MKPVLTAAELAAAEQSSGVAEDVLVARAGAAVARRAVRMLGGAYGRRVVIVAGKGNNGADGRVAAERLRRLGARVQVIPASEAPTSLPHCDLVVDAAYGTGFRGHYQAPDPAGAPVLAVDLPSGLDADTGAAGDYAVRADVTLCLAALKPGLLLDQGPRRAGRVEVADIGVELPGSCQGPLLQAPSVWRIEASDTRSAMPRRDRNDHKWTAAVIVVGGSPGLVGAPWLAARAALRVGAGNVRLAVPGATGWEAPPSEVYSRLLPERGWARQALENARRSAAVVLGPGLGLGEDTAAQVRELLHGATQPVVVDADALTLLGQEAAAVLVDRPGPTVLTPHEGEFERLTGAAPSKDRIGDVRRLAHETGAVVLLKGATTVVAAPDGRVVLATSGTPALATAGTGDVLAGTIAAFLARGTEPLLAAAAAADAHGAAARLAPAGMIAGDLVDLIPAWLAA